MQFPPYTPALILTLGLVPSFGCVVTVDSHSEIAREERRFSLDGTADVRLATFDGSIQIRSWDKPEVLVEIEKRGPSKAAVESLQIVEEQEGNAIALEVKRPRNETFSGMGFRQAASASLVVSVPQTTNIRARSGDGSIKIERITGRIELRTGDGSIRATEVAGDLDFDTGDGSVVVERAEGQLAVDTGDGSVNVSGSLGRVKLHTGDGSVIYRAVPGSRMTGSWDITTGDGSVTMYLPRNLDAEIDAQTGDGRILNDLRIEQADRDGRPRRTLRGRLGSGGAVLRVRTGDGAIRLKMN